VDIHHIIAHELIKEVDQKKAAKSLNTKGPFPKGSEVVIKFLANTQKAFNRRPKALGKFESSELAYPFQKLLRLYLSNKNYDETSFVALPAPALDLLVKSAYDNLKATGGIVIFMHYDNNFMVLLLSRKDAFNLKDFELETLKTIDIDFMRYAVRIDNAEFSLKKSNNDKLPYISFIRGTAQRVSEYFLDFVGCKSYVSPQQSTDEMIEAVREYMLNRDEPYSPEKRREVEVQILEYCVTQRKNNQPVYMSSIAPLVDPENESGLIEYINEKDIKCSDIFEADPTSLKKLKRYDYKSKKWSLAFDHDIYNSTIKYNKELKKIIISDVPEDFEKRLDIINNVN